MQQSSEKPKRKLAMVPPTVTVERGTPNPPSPSAAAAEERLKQCTLPQLSQTPNVLGGGFPSPYHQTQPYRKLSEPHGGASKLSEQAMHEQGGFSFAVPTMTPRWHRSSLTSQVPPLSHASNPNLLQLPQAHGYPGAYQAQSPTFSDLSSIPMGSPRSPLSRLLSGDPHNPFGRKIALQPLCAAGSFPDMMDECGLSPYPSFSPYFGPTFDGFQSTSCLQPRKRPPSYSPLSDLADFRSLIGNSPNSLVAVMNSNPSPNFITLSPNPPGAIGHILGPSPTQLHQQYLIRERKTSIERNENYVEGTIDTTITKQITLRGHPISKLQHLPLPSSETSQTNLYLRSSPEIMDYQSSTTTRANFYNDPNAGKVQQGFHPQLEPETSDPQPCQWGSCMLQLGSISELVQHIERSHIEKGAVEEYICQWKDCPRKGKPFNARYKLVIHMRIHSGEKPNKCRFHGCDKAFSRLENLKIHMRTHTGEKPYVCQYSGCNKSFSNSSDRSKHQKTHIEQKPYACNFPGCDKRYTDPSSLRKHARSHNQQRKKPRNEEPASGEGFNGCLTIQSVQQSNRFRAHDSHKREMKLSRTRNWRKTTTQVGSLVTNQQPLSSSTQQSATFIAPVPTSYMGPSQCTMDHLQPLSPSSPYCTSAHGSPGNNHSPLLHHQQYSAHTSSSQMTPNATYMSSAQMPVEYNTLSPPHAQPAQSFPHSPEQMLALSPGQLISKVPSPATSQYSPYMDVATPGEIPSYIPDHPPPRYEDSIANMNTTAMASMQHLLATETALPHFHSHPSPQY